MKCTKMFSVCTLGALVAGVGLVAMSVTVESEFLRRLGVFPLLLAMFLLSHALREWEAPPAVRSGTQPTDDGTRLGPSAATAPTAPADVA